MEVPLDILDHHNGIIQEESHGHDHCGQGDDVQLVAEEIHGRKGEKIGKGDGDGREDRDPGAGEDQEDHGQGHDDGIPQGVDHVRHAGTDDGPLGVGRFHGEFRIFCLNLGQGVLHRGDGGGDMTLLRPHDVQTDRRSPVPSVEGLPFLVGGQDRGHVPQVDLAPGLMTDHDLFELGLAEPLPLGLDQELAPPPDDEPVGDVQILGADG